MKYSEQSIYHKLIKTAFIEMDDICRTREDYEWDLEFVLCMMKRIYEDVLRCMEEDLSIGLSNIVGITTPGIKVPDTFQNNVYDMPNIQLIKKTLMRHVLPEVYHIYKQDDLWKFWDSNDLLEILSGDDET